MAERAQVTSVEAIEAFRAGLIVYLARARACVDEISSELLRARLWLQEDRFRAWEHEHRLRARKLEEAKSEVFTARLSNLQEASSLQFMQVQRAERAVREAEAKMAMIKKWDRDLENQSEPLLKQANQLQTFLTTEMPRAVAYLAQVVQTLEAYADVSPATPGGQDAGEGGHA
jgi:hypothetical protein